MDKELLDDNLPTEGRTIRVFSTRSRKKIESQATTWGELKVELRELDIPYNGMKAAIGKSKVTLEHKDAQLPAEEFVLYLMPTKTKSGVNVDTMSYKDLKKSISEAISTGESAYNLFNEGKNYTNKKSADLRALYKTWLSSQGGSTKVESVKVTKIAESKKAVVYKADYVQEVNNPLNVILEQLKAYKPSCDEVAEHLHCAKLDIEAAIQFDSEEGSAQREEQAKLKADADKLAEEERIAKKEEEAEWKEVEEGMGNIAGGFDDVDCCDDEYEDDDEDDY